MTQVVRSRYQTRYGLRNIWVDQQFAEITQRMFKQTNDYTGNYKCIQRIVYPKAITSLPAPHCTSASFLLTRHQRIPLFNRLRTFSSCERQSLFAVPACTKCKECKDARLVVDPGVHVLPGCILHVSLADCDFEVQCFRCCD